MMLTLNDGRTELWQWDTGRTLAVDSDCSQVHFSNKVFGRSIDVDVADGTAIIPDVLLQTDKDLNVWAFVGTAENGYTKISKIFKVNRRNKPADYVFTPPDQTSLEEIKERLEYLEQNPVESPVQSVNGRTGAVELNAEDVGAISVETDPTVPGWAKQQEKPTYTAAEVGALPDTYTPPVDSTMTKSGQAADAAAVGDRLSALSEEIANKSGADYTFLNGLKYYACGDSIVDIQGTLTAPETFGDSGYTSDLQSRNITDITVEGYVTAIEQRYGLVATNCGNSGHTLVQDYASLAAKDYSDVALVTIAYGCNDARTNVPLGTVNSTDVTTFAGALNQLLRKIYTDNPECRVIVLTPIQRLYVSDFGIGTANSNGNYLVDFADMCKKVAAKRSTKCIDMYRDCGINQTNLYYYTVEGVHPVNQGFARMKGAIIPVLDDMFALEYEPFGTMTNTGDTEPDEPDTGGDSGGDTPPEEEPGATVVDLSGLFVLAGQYFDPYESFQNNTKLLGIDHPGVALEGGHTYTLITYLPCSADTTWAYGGALANNPSMNPHGGVTLSFGKAVGTFEVITINGNYYGKCSYTFTIAAGSTKYLYTSRAADLDDSYVSLTYI